MAAEAGLFTVGSMVAEGEGAASTFRYDGADLSLGEDRARSRPCTAGSVDLLRAAWDRGDSSVVSSSVLWRRGDAGAEPLFLLT